MTFTTASHQGVTQMLQAAFRERDEEMMQAREDKTKEKHSVRATGQTGEVTGSGVFTLTSKKADPKVGHLQMILRNINLASSLDLPACLLKYATTDCNQTKT